ncbi:unnamed protein product [Didymodactylos carnosus]|uniref:von Willebrand factor type A domain containing protein n=1 Tax=Didymodactylos carnosus TaxID=1234261 RepID=A0A815J481_9BILA|nr:unnamed protein product [Didymodactylos carnosus]CAF1377361.1 unnamed protein product [Didymodactylos carnosus]CAF4031608.1 unnamed protein product [Didymodactylos carnosus]CAF4268922.1 unnamed protein product [Didymodactylos carnosus]
MQHQYVPLKSIQVSGHIQSFAADVIIKQTFKNEEQNPIEAVYCFPIEESASIYSFKARLDDGREIVAELKEKKEAQRSYVQALRQGHGAFLLEQNEKSNDVFTISIGALQPNAACEIEISYVQELELFNGDQIQFVIPTTIAPRYSSDSGGISSPAGTTSRYVQRAPYTIEFNCKIDQNEQNRVKQVSSPSHPISVSTALEVKLSQTNVHLDRDIILQIQIEKQTSTFAFVEQQAVMISFVPTVELCGGGGDNVVNNEYLFIIDCSGSMDGENKIGLAREAMIVFLKSLPVGSHFNIIRFGSTYEKLFGDLSVEYNEHNAKKASKYIEKMKADLGGTELYVPLQYVYDQKPQSNYSRQIFLLTDGEIENVSEVLGLCRKMSLTTRIFSFGLGSAPSRSLVKGLAKATNGSALFIPPKTHVDLAVAKRMEKVLEPCLVNTKIKCHLDSLKENDFQISPKQLPPIYANDRLNLFLLMKQPMTKPLNGAFEFYSDKDALIERITFTNVQPSPDSMTVTRLAAKSYINDYNHSNGELKSLQKDNTQIVIDISLKYSVLSPFTGFVAVEHRTGATAAEDNSNMVLREVPIEISADGGDQDADFNEDEECEDDDEECLEDYENKRFELQCSFKASMQATCCDGSSEEEEKEEAEAERMLKNECSYSPAKRDNKCSMKRRQRSRTRSRSRSPVSSHAITVRQLIQLQDFSGLWSSVTIEDITKRYFVQIVMDRTKLEQLMTDTMSKDNGIDQTHLTSLVIVLILKKYFQLDEQLWKPIVKKTEKYLKKHLAGGNEKYEQLVEEVNKVL